MIKCSHNNAAFLHAKLRKLLPATTATEAPPPGRSEEEKKKSEWARRSTQERTSKALKLQPANSQTLVTALIQGWSGDLATWGFAKSVTLVYRELHSSALGETQQKRTANNPTEWRHWKKARAALKAHASYVTWTSVWAPHQSALSNLNGVCTSQISYQPCVSQLNRRFLLILYLYSALNCMKQEKLTSLSVFNKLEKAKGRRLAAGEQNWRESAGQMLRAD